MCERISKKHSGRILVHMSPDSTSLDIDCYNNTQNYLVKEQVGNLLDTEVVAAIDKAVTEMTLHTNDITIKVYNNGHTAFAVEAALVEYGSVGMNCIMIIHR